MDFQLYLGDCLDIMPTMDANSIYAIVTDPPYGLGFMGKDWDHGVPGEHFWREALRVANPGAHLLAFGGTRTYHRLACAIEDAGWEIRDTIMWVYGSGFPKSHDVSKAIDKAAGEERKVVGLSPHFCVGRKQFGVLQSIGSTCNNDRPCFSEPDAQTRAAAITAPATDAAREWDGWGTALKPAWEPIIVARKPLIGTVAENMLQWRTGGINVDACRIDIQGLTAHGGHRRPAEVYAGQWQTDKEDYEQHPAGRWPANLIHDGSEEVIAGFPVDDSKPVGAREFTRTIAYQGLSIPGGAFAIKTGHTPGMIDRGDSGSASRFFYCAKASKEDRDEGLDELAPRQYSHDGREMLIENPYQRNDSVARNHHPTVKPTDLMRYLCKLVTPPGGVILDPFMGSGSTGKAAMLEGFNFVGIEREAEYIEIARRRIERANIQPRLF
jgi:DNA modification methylase